MSPDGPAGDPGTAAASCPRCISVFIESIQVVNSRIQARLKSTRNKAVRRPWAGGGGRGCEDSDYGGLSPSSPLYPLPYCMVLGSAGQSTSFSSFEGPPPPPPPKRSQPRLPPKWRRNAESQTQGSSGLQGLTKLQNGEDPSQEGTHLEAGGGGWPSAEGSHIGATVALKLSVFWLTPWP